MLDETPDEIDFKKDAEEAMEICKPAETPVDELFKEDGLGNIPKETEEHWHSGE